MWEDLELIGTTIEKDALPIKQVWTLNPSTGKATLWLLWWSMGKLF